MPEATTPSGTQADPTQQPQAGTTPANPPAGAATPTTSQSSQPTGGEDTTPLSLDDAKKLRSEAANLRKRLKEFEDAKSAAEAASLTDLQKLQRQHDTVSKQAEAYRSKIAQMTVQIEAQRLGIVDPEVAATLIGAKLEFGDDGTPTNAEALLKDLVKSKPYLVGQPGQATQATPPVTAGGATNPSRSSTGGGAKVPLSWDYIDQLAHSNTQEYLARHAEIQAWMLANVRTRPRR